MATATREYRKFTFDTDFSITAEAFAGEETGDGQGAPLDEQMMAEPVPEPEAPVFSEDELEAAKAEAFEAGKAEASKEALTSSETRMADTADRLAEQAAELIQGQEAVNAEILADALTLATTIVRKLFPSLNDVQKVHEIEAMIETTVPHLLNEPRLLIRLNPEAKSVIGDRLNAIAQERGYLGKISIVADNTAPEGDCSIEWGSGGVERKTGEIWTRIDAVLADYLGRDVKAEAERMNGDRSAENAGPALAAADPAILEDGRPTAAGSAGAPGGETPPSEG